MEASPSLETHWIFIITIKVPLSIQMRIITSQWIPTMCMMNMEQCWLNANPIPDGDTNEAYTKLLHVTAANAMEITGENLDMGAKNAFINQVHGTRKSLHIGSQL